MGNEVSKSKSSTDGSSGHLYSDPTSSMLTPSNSWQRPNYLRPKEERKHKRAILTMDVPETVVPRTASPQPIPGTQDPSNLSTSPATSFSTSPTPSNTTPRTPPTQSPSLNTNSMPSPNVRSKSGGSLPSFNLSVLKPSQITKSLSGSFGGGRRGSTGMIVPVKPVVVAPGLVQGQPGADAHFDIVCNREKEIEFGGNAETIFYVAGSMQGWRPTNEDAHSIHLQVPFPKPNRMNHEFFTCFVLCDGHGGTDVSHYVAENMVKCITSQPTIQDGDWVNTLKQAFYQIDNDMEMNPNVRNRLQGCTCIVAILTESHELWIASCGDCRAVLCDANGKSVDLSIDHKATLESEQPRIQEAGGFVREERVNGVLAISRALGDFALKQNRTKPLNLQIISPEPDVTGRKLDANPDAKDRFLCLACDGIWDVMSSQQLVNWVIDHNIHGYDPRQSVRDLLDTCCAPVLDDTTEAGTDNMSVIIVAFAFNNPGLIEKVAANMQARERGENIPYVFDPQTNSLVRAKDLALDLALSSETFGPTGEAVTEEVSNGDKRMEETLSQVLESAALEGNLVTMTVTADTLDRKTRSDVTKQMQERRASVSPVPSPKP